MPNANRRRFESWLIDSFIIYSGGKHEYRIGGAIVPSISARICRLSLVREVRAHFALPDQRMFKERRFRMLRNALAAVACLEERVLPVGYCAC